MGTVLKTINNFRTAGNPDYIGAREDIHSRVTNGRAALEAGVIGPEGTQNKKTFNPTPGF